MGVLAERTFLWWRTSEWEAVGVWLTGVLTVALLIYASRQLAHSRSTHDDQTRPYIVVDLSFKSVMVSLAVKNIGQTPAKDVRIKLDAPVASAVMPSVTWQDAGLFGEGVRLFAPGREMQFALDVMPERRKQDLPMTLSGKVEYWRHDGKGDLIEEEFVVDILPYGDALMAPKDIAWIGDELERIRKILAKWQGAKPDELPIQ